MQDSADRTSIDTLLARYASGSLTPDLHSLVAAHLEMSPRNRAYVRGLEDLAAEAAFAADPLPLARRDFSLAAIVDGEAGTIGPIADGSRSGGLPRPIADWLGRDLDDVPWRRLMPGVRDYCVSCPNGGEASLIWIGAGRRVPVHTHEGEEVTLVLKGAFSDGRGRYEAGDIAIADGEVEHRPVADPAGDCLCFAVTDAPLRLTGPVGRIVQRLFR